MRSITILILAAFVLVACSDPINWSDRTHYIGPVSISGHNVAQTDGKCEFSVVIRGEVHSFSGTNSEYKHLFDRCLTLKNGAQLTVSKITRKFVRSGRETTWYVGQIGQIEFPLKPNPASAPGSHFFMQRA